MFLNNNCLFCQIDLASRLGACDFCYSILPWTKNQNSELNTKIFSIFAYQDPIKKLILDLKFNKKLIYGEFLGKILADCVINNWYKTQTLPSVLIPVPLHEERLRNRGFNQAFELSKYIAKFTKIKIDNKSCIRTKNTVNQMSLEKTKRNINIKHAFSADYILDNPYNHIAILDDVVTTGSTIKSLSSAILQQNPNTTIDIWCICKA